MFIALYSPSSVQRVVDFVKTVYIFGNGVPVLVKPIGAAAQIGVPEAFKIAYRFDKTLIVLPEISDLHEVLGVKNLYYISRYGEELDIEQLGIDDAAIIVNGGEQEPSKKELMLVKSIRLKDIPAELPSTGLTAILLYIASRGTI